MVSATGAQDVGQRSRLCGTRRGGGRRRWRWETKRFQQLLLIFLERRLLILMMKLLLLVSRAAAASGGRQLHLLMILVGFREQISLATRWTCADPAALCRRRRSSHSTTSAACCCCCCSLKPRQRRRCYSRVWLFRRRLAVGCRNCFQNFLFAAGIGCRPSDDRHRRHRSG